MLDHLDDAAVVVVVDPPIPEWSSFPPNGQGSDRALARYRDVVEDEVTDEEVVDLADGWDPDLMSADALHPDEDGTAHIASEVADAVDRLPRACQAA